MVREGRLAEKACLVLALAGTSAFTGTVAVYKAALLADTLPRGWVFSPRAVGLKMEFSISTAATILYLR